MDYRKALAWLEPILKDLDIQVSIIGTVVGTTPSKCGHASSPIPLPPSRRETPLREREARGEKTKRFGEFCATKWRKTPRFPLSPLPAGRGRGWGERPRLSVAMPRCAVWDEPFLTKK